MNSLIKTRLIKGGVVEAEDGYIHYLPNQDYGMEWCENPILEAAKLPGKQFR